MRSLPRALLAALAALLLGCAEAPLRPKPVTDVSLDLTLSAAEGSREQPLAIRAVARNVGTTTVNQMAGCGCYGLAIYLFDEQGAPVAIDDPCAVRPACACGPEPLPPGAKLETGVHFEGDVYGYVPQESRCVLEDAPAGTYTVLARCRVFTSIENQRTIERRATFRWTGSS